MNAEQFRQTIDHARFDKVNDENRFYFFVLQGLICIVESLERIADASEAIAQAPDSERVYKE